jgi:hypothetical protein
MANFPHSFNTRALVHIGLLALTGFAASPVWAQNCDRDCMTSLLTDYIDAVVAHDSSKLPVLENYRYTENSRPVMFGEGLWQSVTGKTTFRHDYLDTSRQVAATHVALEEGPNTALYSVLLHLEDSKIAGIETHVQRITPDSRFQPTELGKPVRGMDDPVPAGKKNSRDEMIDIALTYPEGLRIGSFIDGPTPFADGAYRVENGVITAGEGCGRGDCDMYAQNIIVHPGVIASVAAVDEENGTVLLWMNFGHTGDSYGVGNALVTFEAFKVWGGEIHAVNAFFLGLPISTSRFWPSSDPVYKR